MYRKSGNYHPNWNNRGRGVNRGSNRGYARRVGGRGFPAQRSNRGHNQTLYRGSDNYNPSNSGDQFQSEIHPNFSPLRVTVEGSHRILQGTGLSQSHEFSELQNAGNVDKRLSVSPVSSKSAGTPTRLFREGSLSPVSSRHSMSPTSGKVRLSPVSSNASLSPVSDDKNKSFQQDSGSLYEKTFPPGGSQHEWPNQNRSASQLGKRQNPNWENQHDNSENRLYKHRRTSDGDRHYDSLGQNRRARSPVSDYRDIGYRQNRYDKSAEMERQYRRSVTPSRRHYNYRHSRSNSPSNKFSDHSSLYPRQKERRSRSRSIPRKWSRSPKYHHSRSPVHLGRQSRSPSPRHTRSPDYRHQRSSTYRHSVSPSDRHSRSPSYRRYRSRSPKHGPHSHRKSYRSPDSTSSPVAKNKTVTPQNQSDENLKKLTESASESISKTLLFADSAKPEELLSVLLLQNELIRKQQQIIEEKGEAEPSTGETRKSVSPKRQVHRNRSMSPYKRDRERSLSRISSSSSYSGNSVERYRSISPYRSKGRRYARDLSRSPYSRRSVSPYSYSDRRRRSISPYRKTDKHFSERSEKNVNSALSADTTSRYPPNTYTFGSNTTMQTFSQVPSVFPGQSSVQQPGMTPPFIPSFGGPASRFAPPPTNRPPVISPYQFGGPTLPPAGTNRPPQAIQSSFPPVNPAQSSVTQPYGFSSLMNPAQRPTFPVFPVQSSTMPYFPPQPIASTSPTWSMNLNQNQKYQPTPTHQVVQSIPKTSNKSSKTRTLLQVNTISTGSNRNKVNEKDNNPRLQPHLVNVSNMSQTNQVSARQLKRNHGRVNEDSMPEGYLQNEQTKDSGASRDSKILKTFIGSRALLKWYIDRPSYPVTVQVRNGRGEVLFDVYGTEAKIRGTYEDRIVFTGDANDGRIEFMLDNCSYADEGVYFASYGETEFKGPKLVLWLEVEDRDEAVLLWQTEPVPDFEPIRVYRTNGLVLFTAVRQKFTPTEEYKGRVTFTGDTTKGLIVFSLKDCTYGDEGFYTSTIDDKECDGRHLIVKSTVSSEQRDMHVLESVEQQRRHLNRHRERHKVKERNLKIEMLMEGIRTSPSEQPIQNALESVAKSVGLQIYLFIGSYGETEKKPHKFKGVLELLSDGPKITLAAESGKSKKITSHLLYKSAVTSLKTKSLSELLSNSQIFKDGQSLPETEKEDNDVPYFQYSSNKELFVKLKSCSQDFSKRILISIIKEVKIPDEVFAQALKTLYNRRHIDLVSLINAIRDHEDYLEEEGLRPDVDTLLTHPNIQSNAEDIKRINIKIPDHKNMDNFVLLDSGDQKQRLYAAYNWLSKSAEKCGLLLQWHSRLVYGSATQLLPRLIRKCNVWVQGNLVAESYSIGGKYGMQLAAARAMAYLYENRPVIQKVAAKVVRDGNRLTYTKVRSTVEKKAGSGVGDEDIAKACEEILLRYKNQNTLETLEFHPGFPDSVYKSIRRVCAANQLAIKATPCTGTDKTSYNDKTSILTINKMLPPYEILNILKKNNGYSGGYRIMQEDECKQIALDIYNRTQNCVELREEPIL